MAGRDGFVYTRDEMLAVYHRGKFKERDFAERFTHVPNVTTPEFLVPLAFIPMSEEEAKLRANPIAPLPTHQGGRAAGRGYDREGGRGKGRGRGGRGDGRGEPWGPRGSNDGQTNDEHGRLRHWESGDVRISGERASGGKDGAVDGLPSGGLPAPLIAPPPPKEWYYRDLEGIVQGPFAEEQISEWFRLSYLPGNLQMRCSDDPPDAYTPLRDMGAQPLFVRAHIARQKYSAELVRRQRDQLAVEAQQQREAMQAAQSEAAMREKAAIETQLEQQRQQAMVEAARQAMLEQARMEAQEAARRDADELRRSVIEDARKQVEEETRRHREAMQLQMQREAEVLARQQAEAREHARRQALELDMRRAALEKAQQRQQEAEEAARRQAEALARQQAAFEEQKRAMSMLPPANTPGAGSALLSLLQGGGVRPAPNGMAQLPGWNGGQHPHGGMSASSQLEQLWSQASPPAATEPSPSAEQALGRVGRGRGRGVCSAALGTGRQVSRENVFDSASALAGLSLGHADDLGLPSPGMPPASDYADADARLEGEDDDDARRGRKGRKGRAARGKDVETFGADAELPQGGDGMPGRLAAWQQPAPASPPQPKAAAPPQPSKGWAAQALAASPARAPAADRPQSLHAIQEQEERERLRREAAAAQALQAQRAAGVTQPHGVWGSVNKPPAAAPPPPAPPPPRLPEVLPEDAGLWDYGAAGTGAPAGSNGAAPGKAKKKKGKGADESSNGGALEGEADFDLGGENMPSAMAKWCVEQMRGLTGSDDVTLAHFLFSLQDDSEVESYLSMYLGKSDAVSAFAKEFTLRKKAARGLGESRDWQTQKRHGKTALPGAQDGDDGEAGFEAAKGKRKGKKKSVDPSLLGFSVESSRIMQGEIDFPE